MTIIYTASGVVGDESARSLIPHIREEEYEDKFPEGELHKEIIGIHIDAHGDAIDQAFLEVYGISRDAVERKWNHISSLALEFLKGWWADDIV